MASPDWLKSVTDHFADAAERQEQTPKDPKKPKIKDSGSVHHASIPGDEKVKTGPGTTDGSGGPAKQQG